MRSLHTTLFTIALLGCGELKYVPVDLSFVTDPRVKMVVPAEQEKLARDLESIFISIASREGRRDVRHVRRGYLLLIEAGEGERKQIERTLAQIKKECGLDTNSSAPPPQPSTDGDGK